MTQDAARGVILLFDDFRRAIDKALTYAAFFRKADLHVHSHESWDFPRLSDKSGGVSALIAEDYVKSVAEFLDRAPLEERALDIIAITDHNMSRRACEIAAAAPPGRLILPGIEITVKCAEVTLDYIHVVAIFPADMASETMNEIFAGSGMPGYENRVPDSKVTELRIADLVGCIRGKGGICIAAHVNSDSGVRDYVRATSIESLTTRREIARLQEKSERSEEEDARLNALAETQTKVENELQERFLTFLSQANFHAVEIEKPEEETHYSAVHCSPLGLRPVACLLSSDAHCPRDVGMHGHTTYLKMGEVTHDGVRRALEDPQVRVRFEEEKTPGTTIAGIQFHPTDAPAGERGFFSGETIGFSDNLTCLIGSRGAGKSAVIDALRFVFMLPLDKIEEQRLQEDVDGRQGTTLKGTEVRVLLKPHDQEPMVALRQYEGTDSPPTRLFALDGTSIEFDFCSTSYSRVQLFGWSEIEALAKEHATQRKLLDEFIPEIDSLVLDRSQSLEALRTNKGEILEQIRSALALTPKITRLGELTGQLKAIDTPEMRLVFDERDRATKTEAIAAHAVSELDAVVSWFRDDEGREREIACEIRSCLDNTIERLTQEGLDPTGIAAKRQEVINLAEEAQAQYAELINLLRRARTLLEDERTTSEHVKTQASGDLIEKARAAYREELEAGSITDEDVRERIAKRAELRARVDEMEKTKSEIDQMKQHVERLLVDRWETLVPQLRAARHALSDNRAEKARKISADLGVLSDRVKISVALVEDGDRRSFALRLGADERNDRGLLHGVRVGRWRESKFPEQIANHLLPPEFTRAVLDGDWDALTIAATDTMSGINRDQANRILQYVDPRDEAGWYKAGPLELLLELQELEIEDRPLICLDDDPIENCSPGQRCTALIPIILLQGNEPLIIDQPEDNLDNRLVFDVVVDVLRSLKERRQIIAATHNPNIPVSGDAEQIVVLEAPTKDRGYPKVQGCIDRDEVIKEVTDVMEGTEHAFELRARKYGYELTRRKQLR